MLDYSPTKTQKLLGNPDKSDNPTASSPACAGLAGEHCISPKRRLAGKPSELKKEIYHLKKKEKRESGCFFRVMD